MHDMYGVPIPRSATVLQAIQDHLLAAYFSPELSACQIESCTSPCQLPALAKELKDRAEVLTSAAASQELRLCYQPVGPLDMPLDHFDDPAGRYREIVARLPIETLRAGCRVAGTHVHVGLPDADTALAVYNQAVSQLAELIKLGCTDGGERIALYQTMAPGWRSPQYHSWKHYHEVAKREGFADNPRDCWHLIRLTIHGTIEFRMFDSCEDQRLIVAWAEQCLRLCEQAVSLVP